MGRAGGRTTSRMRIRTGKWIIAGLGLLGALFCFFNAQGAELLCVTQGCRLYAGYGLFGISFYQYGMAGFVLILLLALAYPRFRTGGWLFLAIVAALLADTLFLFYQFLYWPCASCLAAALLVGLIAAAGIWILRLPGRSLLMLVWAAWLLLFSYGGMQAAKEIAFRPWAIQGEAGGPIQVFFSPTCPACGEVVSRILRDPQIVGMAAFYPIAKNAQEEARIAAWIAAAGRSPENPPSLADLFEASTEEGAVADAALRKRLLANKVALARQGGTSVPFIVTPFLPETSPSSLFAPPAGDPFVPPATLPFAAPPQGCSAFEQSSDCEEPPAGR